VASKATGSNPSGVQISPLAPEFFPEAISSKLPNN